jgi:hypothetical protein
MNSIEFGCKMDNSTAYLLFNITSWIKIHL